MELAKLHQFYDYGDTISKEHRPQKKGLAHSRSTLNYQLGYPVLKSLYPEAFNASAARAENLKLAQSAGNKYCRTYQHTVVHTLNPYSFIALKHAQNLHPAQGIEMRHLKTKPIEIVWPLKLSFNSLIDDTLPVISFAISLVALLLFILELFSGSFTFLTASFTGFVGFLAIGFVSHSFNQAKNKINF